MRRHDSILFDLDGTLWDETAVTAAAWGEVLARHPGLACSVELNRQNVSRYMGLTCEELAAVFFPNLPFDEAFALINESCALENERLPDCGGILYPGVTETLARLKADGVRLAVVSNAQDGYVEAFLTAHRLWDVFEDYESSGRTGKGKAENIRLVVGRMGIRSPVYVGDTISDRDGARGAGIPFVYCRYGFGETFGRGKCGDYDAAVDSFDEIPEAVETISPVIMKS